MKRLNNWPALLADSLESTRSKPFAWGSHDCALAACTTIEAITGVDPGVKLRGTYDSAIGAMRRMLREYGSADLEQVAAAIAAENGAQELPTVRYAQRGDAVLIDGDQGATLGVVGTDGKHAVFVGEHGANWRPVLDCRRAWRI